MAKIFYFNIIKFVLLYMEYKLDFSNINIDRTLPKISITEVLNALEHSFDQQGVAQKTHDKHFNNPNSPYYQKTIPEIIEMWEAKGKDSCNYGSKLDNYIGAILTGNENDIKLFKLNNSYDYDERLRGLCDSFDNFYKLVMKSGDMEFVDRERDVYLKVSVENPIDNSQIEYYVKGRFDALFYNKRTKKWVVIDWKSSGSIDKVPTKWTDKFLGPMFKWPELNYYRYTNQLHFYKRALLENYLPKDTKEDDVVVMIVNLPGKIIQESGQNYMTHLAGMSYDSNLLDNIFKFAIAKKLLETPKQEETKQEEQIVEQSDNVENLF